MQWYAGSPQKSRNDIVQDFWEHKQNVIQCKDDQITLA
jgi:hypothetical protein